MRTAYLFHGHSRTWKDCHQSFFDNIYSVIPGDVYIHTWDRVNSKYGSVWNGNLDSHKNLAEEISCQTLDLDSIKKAYNPKHIIVETDRGVELALQKYPEISKTNAANAHIGIYNMFLSQYKVFKLAEENGPYDRYFSCRLDLEFQNKLDLVECESAEFLYGPPQQPGYYVFDIFSFGSHEIMKSKADFYHHIWDYWYSKTDVQSYFPEWAVTKYYEDRGIKYKGVNLSYVIKRLF